MSKTFKVNRTDLDFEDVCNAFSEEDSKYLAIRHVTSKRKHTHVYIEDPVEDLRQKISKFNKEHKEEGSRQGPWKLHRGEVDDNFINYMVKEHCFRDNVVANRGFSETDLDDAHAASEEHNKTSGLRGYLLENFPKYDSPEGLHTACRRIAVMYYMETDKCMPPNLRMMVLSYMCMIAQDDDVLNYVAALL